MFQFKFEGVIGNGILGDIALDDISIRTGKCAFAPKTAQLNVPTTTAPTTVQTTPSTTPATRK